MYKIILALTALMMGSVLDAQARRGVQRTTTTVHRPGGTTVHHTTTRAVAHPIYRPGAWNRARIHAGVFHYPRGFTYARWTVGRPLARAFLVPAYYYSGYGALGLAAPPANYKWIRYGPDLMLVNLGTGNVVDIRYGVFH